MDEVEEREIARTGMAAVLVLGLFVSQIALRSARTDVWNSPAAWALLLMLLSLGALKLVETRATAGRRGQYGFLAWCVIAHLIVAGMLTGEWPGAGARLLAGLGQVTFISVVVAFAVAVAEEIFFRKWILAWLGRHMPPWGAVLLSAVLFQLAHFSLLPGLFLGAVAWGYVASRYRSVIATVGMHCLYDTLGFLTVSLPGGAIPAPSGLPGDAFLVQGVYQMGAVVFVLGLLAFIVVVQLGRWMARWRQTRPGACQ